MACVVTFNPDGALDAHLRALRAQFDRVIVVDNGSEQAQQVEQTALAQGCEFLGNGVNLGIAAALNQGVAAARARGVRWLATFDQDSLVPEGLVSGMLAAWRVHPWRERVGVIAPIQRDRGTGRAYHQGTDIMARGDGWQQVRAAITSGSFVRMEVFDDAGVFDERLFIDAVDHDFCLRARRRGWVVIESTRWCMEHSIGQARELRVAGARVVASGHSATRRYYITRNHLEVSRRHLCTDPLWALRDLARLLVGSVLALTLEGQRLAKLAAMLAGARDFARRRFGPRPVRVSDHASGAR